MNTDVTGRHVLTLAICYVIGTFLFGLLPNTFFNYGYNYFQFLPMAWLLLPFALLLLLFLYIRFPSNVTPTNQFAFIGLSVIAFPFVCWIFRTQIHCFGGDGAVGTVACAEFSFRDLIPALPTKGRLDGYGCGLVAKFCRAIGLFENSTVLTTILSTQIYAVIIGFFFISLAALSFRKRFDVFAVLLTLPFVFNFFGNTDNYTFSLLIALAILTIFIRTLKSEKRNLAKLFFLAALWGAGMWTHPFHVFWGFILAYIFGQWIKQFALKRTPTWAFSVCFGIVLFTAIKISPNSNHWFLWEYAKVPPTFSIDTFTHYLNMILLPSVPIIGCILIERGKQPFVKDALILFAGGSVCFFAMAFTIGAVDQFNYQHLLFFIIAPLIIALEKIQPSRQTVAAILICNLSLIIPMIAVHASVRTIQRAEAVYPLDPCQHNRVMSWQTHLGLCLGDNLQDEPAIKKAVLRTFANGARQAQPEGFRGGNYIYHTVFLYHFGEFSQGRAQLYNLLEQNPQVIRWFLNDRPGFIYFNRKLLWADIDQFLVSQQSPQLKEFRRVVNDLSERCKQHPYYLTRPKYAVSEF